MPDYKYTYLILAFSFFIFWLILFLWRKDTRRQMLEMSLIIAFAGPASDILFIKDWWHPETITNTRIGFESFITAFMIGGIGTVLYEDIFSKKFKKHKSNKKINRTHNLHFILLLVLSALLFYGSFYIFHVNSLYSIIIASIIPTMIIWIHRKDLIFVSIVTSMSLVFVSMIVYGVVNIFTPGWVQEFWYFKNTQPIMIFSLPIDDVIWYFVVGLFFGPLYEYWKEYRFVSIEE